MESSASILWRRNDRPGHEHARLARIDGGWQLSGTALFEHEGLPCSLTYSVICDADWRTREALVAGWVGRRGIDVRIIAGDSREWALDGESCAGVSGAIDVDLNFSPSTNLLPIRRLGLSVGQTAEVRAAWLRFPSFTLEPLVQSYTRTGERTYVYESGGGRFVAELQVSEAGWPLVYGSIWSAEAEA